MIICHEIPLLYGALPFKKLLVFFKTKRGSYILDETENNMLFKTPTNRQIWYHKAYFYYMHILWYVILLDRHWHIHRPIVHVLNVLTDMNVFHKSYILGFEVYKFISGFLSSKASSWLMYLQWRQREAHVSYRLY